MIGIGLIILSGIILYFSLSLPKVSYKPVTVTVIVTQTEQNSAPLTTQAVQNDVFSEHSVEFVEDETTTAPPQTTAPATTQTPTTVRQVEFPINLNTCTEEDLLAIEGIGEQRASAIIQYREYLGGYTSAEQLMNIKGFGDGLYEQIAPYVTV